MLSYIKFRRRNVECQAVKLPHVGLKIGPAVAYRDDVVHAEWPNAVLKLTVPTVAHVEMHYLIRDEILYTLNLHLVATPSKRRE